MSKEKNYWVRLANRELEKGESLKVIADALQNIAEKARLEGAWSIFNAVSEAQMKLGV